VFQSHVITVAGVFAGAAVRNAEKSRFITVDPRLEEIDQSDWASLEGIKRVADHVIATGRLPSAARTLP